MLDSLFSIDATVIAAIIGALIGSISTWCLSYFTQERKFNKKKNGAYALIKSEIEINVYNLKDYKKRYLTKTSKELFDIGNLNDISEFYYYLKEFPILSHNNWDKLIDFIPYVFDENQINNIIQFNTNLDFLIKQSKRLYENGMPNRKYSGFYLFELDEADYDVTYGTYVAFKSNLKNVIESGEDILNSFK